MSAGRKSNSLKKDWNTPPKYIFPIKEFFYGTIDLDPCSNKTSLVDAKNSFLLPNENGLISEWKGNTIFVNPPFGRVEKTSLYDWLTKAVHEFKFGKEIIFLIPVATNTRHFKEIIFKKFSAICFLADTRLKFYNQGIEDKKGAPMACCLCYLGHRKEEFSIKFEKYGKVFKINNL